MGSSSSLPVRMATAPEAKRDPMPGTKWWMWRRPEHHVSERADAAAARSRYAIARATANVVTNETSRLKVAFSRGGASW